MFAIVSMATSASSLIALCAISAFLEVSTLSNYELCLNVADKAKCEYYMKSIKIYYDELMYPNERNIINKNMHDNTDKDDNFANINLKLKEKYNLRKELCENSKKETMKKWQKNVLPRSKRSANEFEKFISRVKNIIPKYLHKKVKPAVDKKKSTKDSTRIKKHHHAPHKARKSNQRRITTTIRTKNNHHKH